jgi:membrane associated rhomboid family serine protease
MSQSRFMSLIESVSNLIVGYALAVALQIVVFPWFGLHPSVGQNLAIGALFSAMSLLRSYALRRLFENWRRS